MTRWTWVLGACVATGGLVHLLRDTPVVDAGSQPRSIERAMLDAARNKPEDAALGLLSDQFNLRYFGGTLPDVQVMWASDLDHLDVGDYRLNGMTDGKVILLKAALQNDRENVRRTLCHEMVHVKFIAAGSWSTAHDAAFQAELRRIFEDGCFEGTAATPEEKAALKEWVDSERERLDSARLRVGAQGDAARAESDATDRTFAELNERIRLANSAGSGWPSGDEMKTAERRRTESNQAILAYNAAVAGIEKDEGLFNEGVRRYNLMQAYPDGLAEDRAKGLIK